MKQKAQTLADQYRVLGIILEFLDIISFHQHGQTSLIFLIWILTAAWIVRAVVTLGHVGELMDVWVQFGHPSTRYQECRQVEQIHKHFVTVTERRENVASLVYGKPSYCGHSYTHLSEVKVLLFITDFYRRVKMWIKAFYLLQTLVNHISRDKWIITWNNYK